MNVLIYVDIGQGIYKGKLNLHDMKNKIKLCGFQIHKMNKIFKHFARTFL